MDDKTVTMKLVDGTTGQTYAIRMSSEVAARAIEAVPYSMDVAADEKTEHDPNGPAAGTSSSASEQECGNEKDKDSFRWPHEAILLLIHEYKEMESELKSGKMTTKKFWENIARVLKEKGPYTVTGTQCKSKFTGLKNTYKSVKDHNLKSGNSRRTWQYYELLDNVFGSRPWVEPVTSVDTGRQPDNPTLSSPPKSSRERPSKRLKTQNSGIDSVIAAIDAQRVERRQLLEATLERQDRLISLLEKIANKGATQ